MIKIKSFINKYKWEGKNFPSEKDDWEIFEKNNVTIALNFFYAKNEKNIFCLCFKTWLISWKTISLLMIPNGEKHETKSRRFKGKSEQRWWHHHAVKNYYYYQED